MTHGIKETWGFLIAHWLRKFKFELRMDASADNLTYRLPFTLDTVFTRPLLSYHTLQSVELREGDQETIESSIPTGTHCSNYKAELEAIKEALTILERITPSIPKARAVLLSDSRSVLEKLEDLKGEERQYLAKCLGNVIRNTESLVLQWIPAHCRIEGNERADRLAKEGSVLEQIEIDPTYREVKSIIKTSLNKKWKKSHPEYNKQDGVYCLSRRGQTTIFRLRTGHNRLKHHIHKIFKVGETDLCLCGQAAETAQHVLQDCSITTCSGLKVGA
ncbi:hypothetical protein EGW08_020273 [Elysia chlorotica]|uniref:RNase H type-1 domain-containing protein n=1 Tax=Elysia chlorotica TaxID=188477 RepID=A0A3S1ATV8_ELYCH|nr:hypothetical protein EGW08_020273 [Elysia chlorotica]